MLQSVVQRAKHECEPHMPLISGFDAETSASHHGPLMASRKGGPLSRRRYRRLCCLHYDATLPSSSQQVGATAS